ncbi:Uncharacterized protein CPATCC_0017850 [Cryptosporidium parvum]|uniref:Uncharacterized protein n=1 Tax=Cryptosporidium parvum TaxID=5807 RepID=A0A7S7LGV4_CRYPV|nr:Uncharacterized protein CPATCC_0017850 [Cryptosporidium parvum]|eukprot:QOY41962.1 hypothetical protein CPATCC_001554 [Cryptosporidium parvum]
MTHYDKNSDFIEDNIFGILNNEQDSIENLKKANLIYEEINQKITNERENTIDIKNQLESLIQIIDHVKEMEDQIMEYLKSQKVVKEKARVEMDNKYKESLEEKNIERKKAEEELGRIIDQIKEKNGELSKMDIMIKDVSKDNDSILKSIESWNEKKNQWRRVIDEQEKKKEQLSDLSSYLSERFKNLNDEYNQILQEKKGLIASKDNLEILIEKSKKEGEEKMRELYKVDKEIKDELEEKVNENNNISAEISKLKENNETNEKKKVSIEEEIVKLENDLILKADEIKLSKEDLLRISDELDKKKLETSKFIQELVENKRCLDEINELNILLESKREKLRQMDAKSESSNSYYNIIELEHINEANNLLEHEILSLNSKIKQDEKVLIDEISKLKESKVLVSAEDIEKSLTELEMELAEDKLDKISLIENFDQDETKIDDILNQISKIRQLLNEQENDNNNNEEEISIKKRKGKLKRSKAKNTQSMEHVLIQSLRMIQKIDQFRVGSINQSSDIKETQKINNIITTENDNNRIVKPLESPKSGVSGLGRRVMISNRRLLTPRKGLFAPIPQSSRHRGSRCGDDDTLFGSDL